MKTPIKDMQLDPSIAKKKISELGSIITKALVIDRIHRYYHARWKADSELLEFKKEHGLCTLGFSCMHREGRCPDHKPGQPSPFVGKMYSTAYGKARYDIKFPKPKKKTKRTRRAA